METPDWALSAAYWLHMLATVVWIGGLAALALVVLPAARGLGDESYADLLERIQRRLDPFSWLSLAVLAGTGLFQMSASPNYEGFLAFTNRWAVAILIKHLLFFAMTGIAAYLTWGILPGLRRAALLRARGKETPEAASLARREASLIRLNLALAVLVLALTAVARVS